MMQPAEATKHIAKIGYCECNPRKHGEMVCPRTYKLFCTYCRKYIKEIEPMNEQNEQTEQVVLAQAEPTIDDLFLSLAHANEMLDDLRAEMPQIGNLEKAIDAIKKSIQEYAKANGECSGAGYTCTISKRASWDTKGLEGFAAAYPELLKLRGESTVATIKKTKAGK